MVHSESDFKNHNLFLMIISYDCLLGTVFTRGTPVEDNTAPKCICNVTATYGGKIYNCTNTKQMSTATVHPMIPEEYQFMQRKGQKIIESMSFCIVWTVYVPKLDL